MTVPLRFLVVAWVAEALVASVPWLFQAGSRIWLWGHNPSLLWIITAHVLTAVCPFLAAAFLWSGRDAAACVTLVVVASNWLMWHLFTFTTLAWVWYDTARILLSLLTLCVILAYSFSRTTRRTTRCS